MTQVHVCGGAIATCRRVVRCPKCRVRRRVVEYYSGVWYGCSWECIACGSSWADGEWRPLGLHAGWEKDAHLRRLALRWRNAMPEEEYRRVMREDERL